jgi:hypothetical protein
VPTAKVDVPTAKVDVPKAKADVPTPAPRRVIPRPTVKPSAAMATHCLPSALAGENPPALELSEDDLEEADAAARSVPPPCSTRRALQAIDRLREDIGDLELLGTTWQAAGVCAAALAKAVSARAVFVHSHDIARSEIRVIGAHGPGAQDFLGSAADVDDDFVAATLIANGRPLTLTFDGSLPRLAPERLRQVGAERALVAIPVMSPGGASASCLAILEVVDGDEASASATSELVMLVARQIGALLSAETAAA